MANAQRTRATRLAQPSAEDLRILAALKKASAEAKRNALRDGVPFIASKKKALAISK